MVCMRVFTAHCSTDTVSPHLATIALAWLAYGAVHSALASHRVKGWLAARWPRLMPAYRLVFNALALILLWPPLALTVHTPGPVVWDVPQPVSWAALFLTAAGFLSSLASYDLRAFLGLAQWQRRAGPDETDETFVISPLHRHVRHPWYALGLAFLWTRDLDAAWLTAALVITLYVVVGSRLEENKLIARYGEAYRRYRQRVPAFLPWPGKSLDPIDARTLERLARDASRA